MKKMIPRLVSITSKVWPWLGAKIAWYLWFHPHGRDNSRYPDKAEQFEVEVFGHKMSGFSLGAGEPVMLLHGWGGASTDMAPLAAAIAAEGYLAVVPDLPGHGSDRGRNTDVFRMAATVDAVAGKFGRPQSLVAHSFGAVVAFAAFQHGGPERVVLVAPAVKGVFFVDAFRSQLGLGDRAFARFRRQFVAFAGPYLMTVMEGKGDIPGSDMLVLHDPADDRTPFADSAAYVGQRPATKLIEVANAGHKGILRDETTLIESAAFVNAG